MNSGFMNKYVHIVVVQDGGLSVFYQLLSRPFLKGSTFVFYWFAYWWAKVGGSLPYLWAAGDPTPMTIWQYILQN